MAHFYASMIIPGASNGAAEAGAIKQRPVDRGDAILLLEHVHEAKAEDDALHRPAGCTTNAQPA